MTMSDPTEAQGLDAVSRPAIRGYRTPSEIAHETAYEAVLFGEWQQTNDAKLRAALIELRARIAAPWIALLIRIIDRATRRLSK